MLVLAAFYFAIIPMFTIRYQYRYLLFGLVLVVGGFSQAAGMVQSGVEAVATRALVRQGLTFADLNHYHQSSMFAIIKIMETTGIKVKTLGEASDITAATLPNHLLGRGIMRSDTLAGLQDVMRHAVDNTELANHSQLYHHELIDKLTLYVKIERIAVKMQKMIVAGELHKDIFYASYLEPVLAIRKEGIDAAFAHLRPPEIKVDAVKSKIATLLQKYEVTITDIDNYQTTSSHILQKIIKPIHVTYGKRSLFSKSIDLTSHMLGNKIISDTSVYRLRKLVAEEISEQKIAQQYSQDELKNHIDDVFFELDQALRVERLARDLHSRSHLLDKEWTKRISAVIAKRQKTSSTPLRYNTTWQQVIAYNKSSREIFLEISDTIHAGGWPSLFINATTNRPIRRFIRGETTADEKSLQKVIQAIKRILAREPVPTNITKKMTLEKLNTLLAEIRAATRVERALLEIQKNIDDFSQSQQQHIQQAIAVRDKHLLPNRFRISWDDVQAYTTSSVTVIEALVAALNISLNEVSRHATFGHSVLSDQLRGIKNMRDNIAAEASHAFCRIIATADLPTATTANLRNKALSLPKLVRTERAAYEIPQNHKLNELLTHQQKELLHKVQVTKEAALMARAQAKTTNSK